MKYLKTYEKLRLSSYIGIKKDDIVVFYDKSAKLKQGEKYIVNDVRRLSVGNTDTIINSVENSSDFITVKDFNGNIILSNGEPMIFYAYRFLPEFESDANKYNI